MPGFAGPLLQEVLEAQRASERIVGDYAIFRWAVERILEHARTLGAPLLWPVGEPGERLCGGAVLAGKGEIRARGWTNDVHGQRVLLVVVADITTLALQQAAQHARNLGAAEIHACGVGEVGAELDHGSASFDSYRWLSAVPVGSASPSLTAIAAVR